MRTRLLAFLFTLPLILSTLPAFAAGISCGQSGAACASAPVEGSVLFNTQTTGAATTAVTVTLTAVQNSRAHIYQVEARCNTAAATSGLTITDGGTTIWSTVGTEVGAAANFVRAWPTGLTGASGSAVVITLAACTAGTGTLIVEADKW